MNDEKNLSKRQLSRVKTTSQYPLAGSKPHPLCDPEEVKKYAELGLTQDQIAGCFGICERTFQKQLSQNQEIREAYDTGRAQAVAKLAGKAWSIAMDDKRKDQFAAIAFLLKTKGGYSEHQILEHQGKNGGPIQVENKEELLDAFFTEIFPEGDKSE